MKSAGSLTAVRLFAAVRALAASRVLAGFRIFMPFRPLAGIRAFAAAFPVFPLRGSAFMLRGVPGHVLMSMLRPGRCAGGLRFQFVTLRITGVQFQHGFDEFALFHRGRLFYAARFGQRTKVADMNRKILFSCHNMDFLCGILTELRLTGLEPARRKTTEPKSAASANSAITA